MQKFVNDYKSRYNTIPDALWRDRYDAAHIMFDAIKRANSLDGTAFATRWQLRKTFPA